MKKTDTDLRALLETAAERVMEEEEAAFDAAEPIGEEEIPCPRRRFLALSRAGRRIAAGIAAVFVSLTALLCIQPVRAALTEAVVTWYGVYVSVFFDPQLEQTHPAQIDSPRRPRLPEGYTMEELRREDTSYVCRITSQSGAKAYFRQAVYKEGEMWYEQHDCVMEQVSLTDRTLGYLLRYADGETVLVWVDGYAFCFESDGVEKETLIEMARSLYA